MTFNRERYEAVCREWTSSDADFDSWIAVGEALGNRPGWYFGTGGNPESIDWAFGQRGAARLVLTADLGGGLVIFDHAADGEYPLGKIERVMRWLNENEARYEGLTPLQIELEKANADSEEDER